jgi:site-specific recombinase XerD
MSLLNDFIEYERLKGYREDTISVKRKTIECFLSFIGPEYRKANREDILEFIDELKERGISSVKINLHLSHLEQFYTFCLEQEDVLVNPVALISKLKSSGNHSGIFSEDEIKEMLTSSETYRKKKSMPLMKRDRAILELLYSTGIRMTELVNLDIDDIDFEEREVTILYGKGDKERIVPAGDEALTVVREYLALREKYFKPGNDFDALFLGRQGGRLSAISVRRMILRRKSEAGISTKGTTHAFRRSFASHILAHGAPLPVIGMILGHTSLDTTTGYTLVDDDLHRVYRESHPRGRAGHE